MELPLGQDGAETLETGRVPANRCDVFISYARDDATVVAPEVQTIRDLGYSPWFDHEVPTGAEWPAAVQSALEKSPVFLVYLSSRAAASKNVRNEINRAASLGKRFVVVLLEDTPLSAGVGLQLGAVQSILRFRLPPADYEVTLRRALSDASGVHDDFNIASSRLVTLRLRAGAFARWFGGMCCATLIATVAMLVTGGRFASTPLPQRWFVCAVTLASASVLLFGYLAIRHAWIAGIVRRRSMLLRTLPLWLSVFVGASGLALVPFAGRIDGIVIIKLDNVRLPVENADIALAFVGSPRRVSAVSSDSRGHFEFLNLPGADGAEVVLTVCSERGSALTSGAIGKSTAIELTESPCLERAPAR